MPNRVILVFQYKAKFEKKPILFRSEIDIFDLFFKSFEDLQISSNENFETVQLCPRKWRPFKVFVNLDKSPLLIANIVKDAFSGLRQFLVTESP